MNLLHKSDLETESEFKNSMKKWRVDKELALFFILTNLLSWVFWIPGLLKGYGVDLLLPEDFFIILGNFTPSILGVLMTAAEGKAGVLGILKDFTKFRYPLKWYIYTIFLMPGILLSAYFISYFIVGLELSSILMPIIFPEIWPLIPLILYFLIWQGPLGEEFGWRAYALPRLLKRYEPLRAGLIIGIIWAFWHLPKFFLIGSTQHSITKAYGIVVALIGYVFYTTMLSLMITLLYIKTGKSMWAVLLFHAMANFSHGLITILTNATGGISIILVMLIVLAVLLYRFKKEFLFPN